MYAVSCGKRRVIYLYTVIIDFYQLQRFLRRKFLFILFECCDQLVNNWLVCNWYSGHRKIATFFFDKFRNTACSPSDWFLFMNLTIRSANSNSATVIVKHKHKLMSQSRYCFSLHNVNTLKITVKIHNLVIR